MKSKIIDKFRVLSITLMTMILLQGPALASELNGYWQSKYGSVIEIDGNKGTVVFVMPKYYENFKGYLNETYLENIRQKGNKWVADMARRSGDILYDWLEAELKISGNKLILSYYDKGKEIYVYHKRIDEKALAALTEKHKQHLVSAKQKELEKKLRSIAGFSNTDSGAKYTMVDKDSGAQFTVSIQMGYFCRALAIGEIPEHIDLADDTVAKKLLHKGYMFAKSKCPQKEDPSALVVLRKASFEMPWLVRGGFDRSGRLSEWDYGNKAKELAQKEREKAEEERKRAEANKRLKIFEKKYGVTDWPVMKEFHVNPFIYEGKKVAFVSEFGTMLSATEGIFKCGGEFEYFIVSDIPKGFFSKEAEVVITGRPLGKKETKLPLFGEVLVPNLKFVGAYFCEEQHCKDIVWK